MLMAIALFLDTCILFFNPRDLQRTLNQLCLIHHASLSRFAEFVVLFKYTLLQRCTQTTHEWC